MKKRLILEGRKNTQGRERKEMLKVRNICSKKERYWDLRCRGEKKVLNECSSGGGGGRRLERLAALANFPHLPGKFGRSKAPVKRGKESLLEISGARKKRKAVNDEDHPN